MTNGEMEDAKRRALNLFDNWNDVAGGVHKGSSLYYELQSVIEDAVHCGAQAATRDFRPLESEEEIEAAPDLEAQLQAIRPEDGDVLVVTAQGRFSKEEAKVLCDQLTEWAFNYRAATGKAISPLVVDGGMKVEFLRRVIRIERASSATADLPESPDS